MQQSNDIRPVKKPMHRRHWILWTLMILVLSRPGIADKVYILDSPEDGLIGRVHILDAARDSIDIMYFSIHDDSVTAAALAMVREKALAGIRVRMITASSGFDVDPAKIGSEINSIPVYDIEDLRDRIVGRVALEDIVDPLDSGIWGPSSQGRR